MAATKTLGDMRARAKLAADMENSSFLTDTEWNDNINDSCKRLYNKLVDVLGQEYYATTDTSTETVSGTAYYDLPEDFFFLLDLMLDDNSSFVNPETFELKERAILMSHEANGLGSIHSVRYRLSQNRLELRPKPNGAFTVTYTYVPTYVEMTSDTSTFDGVNGWERWVELDAAITALNKEESDPSPLLAKQATIGAEIDRLKGRRDAGRPPRIQDTKRDWAGNNGFAAQGRDWDA
jgi:hypothetical protein